jgi:hypothetical protein
MCNSLSQAMHDICMSDYDIRLVMNNKQETCLS